MAWVEAGNIADIPAGRVKLVFYEPDDLRIAVCNVDGQYFAIEDVCTHDGGSLDQGDLEGDEIECPRHGARFNVRTGDATLMPAVMPVRTFPVKIEGQTLLIGTEAN
ncbi:MAG TPA: non-heme iron oxygenase ferredoxin subunit [Chloroflexota bacterium]|nr:non-heme iron oxygenase ferredoxin subunit [Chloroflexota bacterium]